MTRGDRLLIAAIAVALLAAWPLGVAVARQPGRTVMIEGPAGATSVPLDRNARLSVEGDLGPVEVRIEDGTVRVIEAGCPDHVCVRTGAVASAGALVACVPNGVTVRIEGRAPDGGLDAVVR
jgi:hypothetical protein